jgi:hypothetical protein
MDKTYSTAPDGYGEMTLWSGPASEPFDNPTATKRELDRMDPAFWPILVAALVPPAEDDDLRGLVREVCEYEGVARAIAMYRRRTERPAITVDIPTARAAVERLCADLLATAVDTA